MNKMRNFALHISAEQKERLKKLAADSNMTLTQYVEEVLNDAVREENLFEVRAHKIPGSDKGRFASMGS